MVLKYRNCWIKLCVFSGLSGMLLALGNAYRPIFVVFLLAVFVCWLISALGDKKEIKLALISSSLIAISYLVVGVIPGMIYSRINPYYSGTKSQAGWSFYVGANYETSGRWNSDDRDLYFGDILEGQSGGDIVKANGIIMKKGLRRYVDILADGHIVSHFLRKIAVIFGDVKNSIYDLPYIFNFSKESEKYKILQDCIMCFYSCVLAIMGCCVFGKIKKKDWLKKNTFMLFLVVLIVGLFFASLLVEAMNRYSLPLMTVMIIIALGMIFELDNNKMKV